MEGRARTFGEGRATPFVSRTGFLGSSEIPRRGSATSPEMDDRTSRPGRRPETTLAEVDPGISILSIG